MPDEGGGGGGGGGGGVGLGTEVGVGVGRAVGVGVGVGRGVDVGVAVGLEVGVAVGLEVGVAVGVPVGPEVGVRVGEGVADAACECVGVGFGRWAAAPGADEEDFADGLGPPAVLKAVGAPGASMGWTPYTQTAIAIARTAGGNSSRSFGSTFYPYVLAEPCCGWLSSC